MPRWLVSLWLSLPLCEIVANEGVMNELIYLVGLVVVVLFVLGALGLR
jgi:hypothetical protein